MTHEEQKDIKDISDALMVVRVWRAVSLATLSSCRSKRGVVVWDWIGTEISVGFNYQPTPFQCDGSAECKRNCGETAIHAEQAAIMAARVCLTGSSMLHVKQIGGYPVASGPPSCLECSKLILASGISWMHLLHASPAQLFPGAEIVGRLPVQDLLIVRYSAVRFHEITAEFHGTELIRSVVPA